MNPTTSKLATLMGTASFLTMVNALSAQAQQMTAQAQMAAAPEGVPEQVLITGSLIHGTAAVGVPVTNLSVQDFAQTGAQTVADLFRSVPEANVFPGASATDSGGHQERDTRVNIRGLDQTGPRSVMLVDGMRHVPQADGICSIDPDIIPSLALDRIDILADGASATYGSDAIAGVINIILKRGYDGAVTQLYFASPTDGGGGQHYQASQLWGRTWDGGDITLTYQWWDEKAVKGSAHAKYTENYTPWGLDDERPLAGSMPGTLTIGATAVPPGVNGGNAKFGTNCTNCFAIPNGTGGNFNAALNNGLGPLTPGSAATLNWATFSVNPAFTGTNGTQNVFDTLKTGYEIAPQQQNSAVITVDQRLTSFMSFFGEGYYTNRRVQQLVAAAVQPVQGDLITVGVPTTNPYYPTGAPGGLRVNYDTTIEIPSFVDASEISDRYQYGVNLTLPFSWSGSLYDVRSYDSNNQWHTGTVNKNAISAALGWTIGTTPPNGTYPAIGSYAKPATVPYLNLFCDARAFQCNSPTTLQYITGTRFLYEYMYDDERGAKFDGPIFDLPGGQVKVAVGGTYSSFLAHFYRNNNTGSVSLISQPSIDSEPYQVAAEFAQLNIPIFEDVNAIPFFRKLELEASWRHDQYHGTLNGGTSNPKLAFTWGLSEELGATIRGSWGTNFRFANAGEYSVIASDSVQDYGLPSSGFGTISVACNNGAPVAGSAFAKLFAAGAGCGTQPIGISNGGGPQARLRNYINASTNAAATREGGVNLAPEKSTNWSIGGELAPQNDFLRGLDIQATWYQVKINGLLSGYNNPTSNSLNSPSEAFHYIVPSDLGCPVAANANPGSCAPFESMVAQILADPSNGTVPSSTPVSSFTWINDGGTVNTGFLKLQGVDWNASYDWDLGPYGAWNTGITGTYYLHRYLVTTTGGPILDGYSQNLPPDGGVAQNGVETAPRMIYRARLGWSDGAFSVTGFLNYFSHYFTTQSSPPNVNFQCTAAGGNLSGGTFPCAISNYTNFEPAMYTFDLSLGYNTGDTPANDYLKRIGVQLVVQNVLGLHPAFSYGPSNAGRGLAAYDILKPDLGRVIAVTITKTW